MQFRTGVSERKGDSRGDYTCVKTQKRVLNSGDDHRGGEVVVVVVSCGERGVDKTSFSTTMWSLQGHCTMLNAALFILFLTRYLLYRREDSPLEKYTLVLSTV